VERIRNIPFKKEIMSKTLGGFIFIKDGEKYDYCYQQAVESLLGVCDKVSLVYFTPTSDWIPSNVLVDERLRVHALSHSIWDAMFGKTKISHLQNLAAACLDTDYQLLVQADEVITPDSYYAIREAMETGGDGFLCERVNLWGSPNTRLVAPKERQPCSTYVNRLTKRGYWCYDDGENIASPTTLDFVNRIKIIHYGFVRKKEVMKAKIINMQESVFAMGHHDPKLDGSDVFDSTLWFSGNDLAPIDFEHPDFMQKWVLERM
jgi:hypothetical protein